MVREKIFMFFCGGTVGVLNLICAVCQGLMKLLYTIINFNFYFSIAGAILSL